MGLDNKYAQQKERNGVDKQMKRLRGGQFKQMSYHEHVEAAKTLQTKHDENWASMDERDDIKTMEHILTKSFWNSVPAPIIIDELKRVLPGYYHFYKSKAKKNKKDLLRPKKDGDTYQSNLGVYLELVKKIVKKKEKDIINSQRRAKALENVSEHEYLTVFVKFQQSQHLAEQNDSEESNMDKMRAIIASNGNKISSHKQWQHKSEAFKEVEVLFMPTLDQLNEGLLDE